MIIIIDNELMWFLPALDPLCFSLLNIVHVTDCYGRKREFVKRNRLRTQRNDDG